MKSRYFHTTTNRCTKPRPIRLTGLKFDDRTDYIDSVCAVLNESRFGPAVSYSLFNRPTGRPANDPVSLLDLIDEECVSWFEADSCQNRLRQRAARETRRGRDAETRRLESLRLPVSASLRQSSALGRAPTPGYFPWALGRGSP